MTVLARAAAATAALLLLAGCEAVPELTFDGGPGSDEAGDASETGDVDAGCTSASPASAICCGPPLCHAGFCTAANCRICMGCASTEVCCSKTNNAVCQPANTTCH